jgi:hypothetical protein
MARIIGPMSPNENQRCCTNPMQFCLGGTFIRHQTTGTGQGPELQPQAVQAWAQSSVTELAGLLTLHF